MWTNHNTKTSILMWKLLFNGKVTNQCETWLSAYFLAHRDVHFTHLQNVVNAIYFLQMHTTFVTYYAFTTKTCILVWKLHLEKWQTKWLSSVFPCPPIFKINYALPLNRSRSRALIWSCECLCLFILLLPTFHNQMQ